MPCTPYADIGNGIRSRGVLFAKEETEITYMRCTRRESFLRAGSSVSASTAVTLLSTSQPAMAAQTTAEAIRRSAANIPGYGQPDVYYPPSYLGRWNAARTIVVSDNPALQNLLPATINYEMRFISVDGDVGDPTENGIGGKVVADRAFNEKSYYDAIRNAVSSDKSDSRRIPPQLQSAVWDPSNPNVLTSVYADGTSQEIKVTKRAATLGQDGEGTVSSSEYRRISDIGTRGIPVLSASRVLSKWRSDTNERGVTIALEGIEIVYADGVMGDPMGGGAVGAAKGGASVVSSKSRVRLDKIN